MPSNTLVVLIDACREAGKARDPLAVMRGAVRAFVSDADQVHRSLGRPSRAQVQCLHRSDALTILNTVWAPRESTKPHNHRVAAITGIYWGREEHVFWKRVPGDSGAEIESLGEASYGPGEVSVLSPEVIHSVSNPTSEFAGSIHLYAGDYFRNDRSEWDPATLEERPFDVASRLRRFGW